MFSQVLATGPLAVLAALLVPQQQVTPLHVCADTIKDQAGGPCLKASSDPTLGMLFPISQQWYIGPGGEVGIGTTTPSYDFEIANGPGLLVNSLALGVKGNCANAAMLALNNTDPVGHNWVLASWGSAAGAGVLPGKFSLFDITAGTHRFLVDTNGNVGVGPNNYYPAWTLDVNGTMCAASKMFRIDHPLDPKNKTLEHSCVESSEMLDMYRGNTTLDDSGTAVVEMPSWFEALNQDFSYQLTPIGKPAPGLYIAEEIARGQFKIAGGTRGARVSWLVTGVRHDAYAKAHPLVVERDKEAGRGKYLYPNEQAQQAPGK